MELRASTVISRGWLRLSRGWRGWAQDAQEAAPPSEAGTDARRE